MQSLSFIQSFLTHITGINAENAAEKLPAILFAVVSAVLTLIVGFWLGNLAGKLLVKILEKRNVDRSVHFFLSKTLSTIIKIIFVITALSKLGFNINSFVAAIGAAGVTAGIGLKDCISQFASGIQILLNQPFKSGDFVELESVKGKVQDIHLMYTTLIMEDNRQVTVPNDHITSNNIINYTAGDFRRADLIYSISYSEDIAKAKAILYDVAKKNVNVLDNPPVYVAVKEHAGSSINLVCQVWCKSDNYYPTFYTMQEEVKLAFDANNIEIPFEQLDVHIKNEKE
ncbi:MAG: mechanosensitive ion channel [Clostridia bacterium]|nr:mechanosensitive ion channel [Clostridia bacterium]